MSYKRESLNLHKQNKGKIEIRSKVPLNTRKDLSLAYTPGVAEVSRTIADNKEKGWQLTNRANTVAVVSDGSAVLGLGNTGPEAGIPVMEGKSVIFKKFAGVDAYPLCINSSGVEDIVSFCLALEPSVGGINLEDISAPACFEVLERLEKELNIPVFHDDQDGTAIVTLAALINACRVTGKKIKDIKVVMNGAGAAGIAIARLLLKYGVKDIKVLDRAGMLAPEREELNKFKQEIALQTNKDNLKGRLEEALSGSDVLIGVSEGGIVSKDMIRSMNPEPIVFAMANPDPEILPDNAKKAGASIVGTGRSDYPNQINNALVFPGVFRGMLDSKARRITSRTKIGAARALAHSVKNPTKSKVLPPVTDTSVVDAIAAEIKKK